MALFAVVLMAQLSWAAESVRVKVERANLRSAPSTDSRIVDKVSEGTVLQVLGRQGDWIHVTAPGNGSAAYISASLCELVPSAPPAPAEPVAPEPAPAAPTFGPSTPVEPRQFGVHLSWANESIDFGLGVRASTGIPLEAVPHLGALVTFDYFFGAATKDSAADVSGHSLQLGVYPTYSFELQGVNGYAGAGLSHFRTSFEASDAAAEELGVEVSGSVSKTSLGIVVGAKFEERFFGEIRYHFGDADHVTVSAGILFDSPW